MMVTYPRAEQAARYVMENGGPKKDYVHYNHTLASNFSRWTAREAYQFMYNRPWQKVVDFYSRVVTGQTSLPGLFGSGMHSIPDDTGMIEGSDKSEAVSISTRDRSGRWARTTFKIVLSYHGASFDGWQKQPGLNTVQGLVEKSLGKFVDEKKARQLEERGLPLEGCAVVAGRTDKGVTAFQQVCSFYTWRKEIKARNIEDTINSTVPGKLRALSVSEVSRAFHPNFSAKWRRYLYIFPFNGVEEGRESSAEHVQNVDYKEINGEPRNEFDKCTSREYSNDLLDSDELLEDEKDELGSEKKPTGFTVSKVDQLLRQLEGKLLSYKMFARDTKPSRNIGPPTECFLFHARAAEITLSCDAKDGGNTNAMCIELVANRFLRKMVRVLVATAIREAAAGAEDDSLIRLMDATCRRATAPPAPPNGLCLVDVGYKEFDPQTCLIF